MTLFIVILLYQKFGIESKFIERQIDKVLELVDLFKGKVIKIETNNYTYCLRFSIDNYDHLTKSNYYNDMKSKIIIFDMDDYEIFTNPINNIKYSYWLPNEIKEKMDFLDIKVYKPMHEDAKEEKFARVVFKRNNDKMWYEVVPSFTVEEYIKKKNEFIQTIEDWLTKYSDIKLDLKFDEPNQESNLEK